MIADRIPTVVYFQGTEYPVRPIWHRLARRLDALILKALSA